MDIFCEHIVQKRKGIKEILMILGIFLATVVLVAVCGLFLFTPFGSVAFLLTIGIVVGSYYLVMSFNIEYEYILTNGELDIDCIRNRSKRKRLITVSVKTFDVLAPVGKPELSAEERATFTRVIDASSYCNSGYAYFAVFSKDGQKIKLIFEPDEQMLEKIRIYIPNNVK